MEKQKLNPQVHATLAMLARSMLMNRGGFTSALMVSNRAPAAGEKATYMPSGAGDYCAAAYLPNPEPTGKVLLNEGTTSEAAEGCGEFLLWEPGMENLQKKLGTRAFSYFQMLLRTSQVGQTPMTATLVAERSFPNLR